MITTPIRIPESGFFFLGPKLIPYTPESIWVTRPQANVSS
jgi:hypothetical protein